MNILLSGYGAMGKVVAELAQEKGHQIAGIFSLMPVEAPFPVVQSIENLPKADVIIDFSHPDNITPLLEHAANIQVPMVIATTGARQKLQSLMEDASKHCPVFFSANMSYGIHVFTQVLKFLTPLLSQDYDIEIIERHHNKKIDSPSGTAIKLLEAIQAVNEHYYPIFDRSQGEHKREAKEIGMSAVRGGSIVGEHEVLFAGLDEVIEITHRAQSKRIFADGAIKAGEKLVQMLPGYYTFDNLI